MAISGKHLLTFAVIADTHMNQAEDYSSSPFPCNALANARTRRVIAELNRLEPEFVVHLGDIVNPVPELPTYEDAANHFKTLVADLEPPLYLVPGNHDVGDKPVSWMPAGRVNDEHLALYEGHFGPHYLSFDHGNLHFIVVNAPIINSGLAAEAEQAAWLEKEFADNADRRVFVCIHYPPYVSNPDENGSYDNLDEPGRSWFNALIEKHKPEAMFCGHVHNFWYDRLGETEMYILPSTAFVRQDYSEFYRIEPGDQLGRNDEPKLGYFVVRLYEKGHVAECVRTYGRTLDPGAALPAPVETVRRRPVKESDVADIGLDMRQPWAEELEITASGAVDEFERKIARNDYPVLALWEMGMRRMRMPVQDLVNPKIRRRMEILARVGHLFQVYCYGVPDGAAATAIREHGGLIDALEIVINWDAAESAIADIATLNRETDLSIVLSRVNRKDAAKHTGGRYNHLISHGFTLQEADELQAFFAGNAEAHAVDGLVFAVPRETAPAEAARGAAGFAAASGKSACLYVKSVSASPAEAFLDERANAARTAEAILACAGTAGVTAILDTFADIDRSYFARAGLVDRRFNPKLGSRVVGNLFGLLHGGGWRLSDGAGVTVSNRSGVSLTLARDGASLADGQEWIDLGTGEINRTPGALADAQGPVVIRKG